MPDEEQEQLTPEVPAYSLPEGHRYADPKHSKLIQKMFRSHLQHRLMKFKPARMPRRKKR